MTRASLRRVQKAVEGKTSHGLIQLESKSGRLKCESSGLYHCRCAARDPAIPAICLQRESRSFTQRIIFR